MVKHFKYPIDGEDHSGRFIGFEELSENTIDVLFLGTSHAMYAVLPLSIYKNEGVASYNLATSLQTLDVTYALLMDAFRTQDPKAVMLDVSNLYLDSFYDSSCRWTADHKRMDAGKLRIARGYERSYTRNISLKPTEGVQEFLSLFEEKAAAAFFFFFRCTFTIQDGLNWDNMTLPGKRKTYSMGLI